MCLSQTLYGLRTNTPRTNTHSAHWVLRLPVIVSDKSPNWMSTYRSIAIACSGGLLSLLTNLHVTFIVSSHASLLAHYRSNIGLGGCCGRSRPGSEMNCG
ncbi:hypothetical protein DICSQDRAFT_140577 [Dichomitus squalens LYAD-421 SS1]|uniref:Uncharacterized protein n=2 Tax=Dichomitus squalens TaxID=114155 RepID=A0A4Q9M7G7_9APHY|nr:uncharacterized protein DICSQDRAFT_140577 [Dichomitus squalens LYAD-421 SS1]EJF57134.1 hypothetical protein DICSQDRAFT_140577 [Dichomitus squalens LYAD-421 SS1]TBU22935.1 hypothetical protein BD311DRAFT_111787 [Dichomitus squalens]